MKKILAALLILLSKSAYTQHGQNTALKIQLDSVIILDQKYRDILSSLVDPKKADSLSKQLHLAPDQIAGHYWTLQNRLDSANVVFVEGVFEKYGYPGKTLVGVPSNETAWYVIQHSKKIDKYLPLMKKAADEGELPFRLYAMMLDRQLMNENKEQIYGTQGVNRRLKNGQDIGWYIWPIKDPKSVNERRKKAGFEQTVEENAQRMGISYRVIRIDEVK